MLPSQRQIDAERLRRSLHAFLIAAWPQIDPSQFVPGWHFAVMCELLEQAFRGEVRRLIINLPPRHGYATIDLLQRDLPDVTAVRPEGSKISRAHAISATVESGNAYLPGDPAHGNVAAWVDGYLLELLSFPSATSDDQETQQPKHCTGSPGQDPA